MGEEIVLFESEEHVSRDDVVAYLRELADQLAANDVVLQQGSDSLRLQIPERVVLEVEVEEEKEDGRTERSLEIEIEWYVEEQPEESEESETTEEESETVDEDSDTA